MSDVVHDERERSEGRDVVGIDPGTGEATRSPNKTFLIRRITEALQAADADAKAAKAKEPEADAPEATPET